MEKIRKFSNGLSKRTDEIEEISEYIHDFSYKVVDCEPEPCWLECEYKATAERLYELLGGYDETMSFLRNLQLVSPDLFLELIKGKV